MTRFACKYVAPLVAMAFAGSAFAATITIDNASFEGPSAGTTFPAADVWLGTGSTGVFVATAAYTSGLTDSQAAYIGGTGSLEQVVDADPFSGDTMIVANTTYELKVDVGYRIEGSTDPDDYLIELIADPAGPVSELVVASASLANASGSMTPGTFQELTASFTAPASGGIVGGELMIRLTHTDDLIAESSFVQGNFDNVRLTAVPEPSSLALLAMGGLAMIKRRRRG